MKSKIHFFEKALSNAPVMNDQVSGLVAPARPSTANAADDPNGNSRITEARSLIKTLFENLASSASTSKDESVSKLRDQIWEMFSPEKTDILYLESVTFRNVIRLATSRCGKVPSKVKILLKEVLDNMKLNAPKDQETMKKVQGNKTRLRKNKDKTKPSQTWIDSLYKALYETSCKIQEVELQEEEDDDEAQPRESNYVFLNRLKKRAVQLYEKIQELECTKKSLLRETKKAISVKSTSYPEINRATARMATRCAMKDMTPDFQDVLAVVSRVNSSDCLGMNEEKKRSVAVEAFQEIVLQMKRRRIKETQQNLESLEIQLLLEKTEVPQEDATLAETFEKNRLINEKNMESIINEFADKQANGVEKSEEVQTSEKVKEKTPLKKETPNNEQKSDDTHSGEDDENDVESELDESYLNSDSEEDVKKVEVRIELSSDEDDSNGAETCLKRRILTGKGDTGVIDEKRRKKNNSSDSEYDTQLKPLPNRSGSSNGKTGKSNIPPIIDKVVIEISD